MGAARQQRKQGNACPQHGPWIKPAVETQRGPQFVPHIDVALCVLSELPRTERQQPGRSSGSPPRKNPERIKDAQLFIGPRSVPGIAWKVQLRPWATARACIHALPPGASEFDTNSAR